MKKNTIRLTESQLHRVIKESVKRVLNEIGDTERGQYALGMASERNYQRQLQNGNYNNPFYNRTKDIARKHEITDHAYKNQDKASNGNWVKNMDLYHAFHKGQSDYRKEMEKHPRRNKFDNPYNNKA